MEIKSLSKEHEELYLCCLEDWSDEMKEQGEHRLCWYNQMKDRGLGVKLALENGEVGGMIQYIPVEDSPVDGKNLYFILCIWVHGHRQGRGSFQKRGFGRALLAAAEEDVKRRGADGLCAWGLGLPVWMRASWFKKHGYTPVDKSNGRVLLLKKFNPDVIEPSWILPVGKPEVEAGKVVITALVNGSCSIGGVNYERAKRAASEFGEEVVFKGINTCDRDVFARWGMTDTIFLDDKIISNGPPLKTEKIKRKIANKVRKL
ncbi:MAG: GNAT family N-acetyltransferase [Spirochaetales bacterium]|nr:GNAT family N-acetyltransferase [Spirochaetales bacterium]